MPLISAIVAGIVFGAGLTISDMVNPARVLNFLDFAGSWDATLLFVMASGLAVTAVGYRLIFRRSAPLCGDQFNLPTQQQIDLPLVGGAALFGVGWGLAGICPGPALTDLATLQPKVLLFVIAMLAGMFLTSAVRDWLSAKKALRQSTMKPSE
jgi:uncharacterized membrane protein YedE/YeeE